MDDITNDYEVPASAPLDESPMYPYAEPGPSDVEEELDLADWQVQVTDWIRSNQNLAMVLGFGFGVFMGVMMRD